MDCGDAVVIARCHGADEYAKTSAGKDWNYHWYLVPMDVLAVERGVWIEKQVNFVYPDAWPTPGSGMIGMRERVIALSGKFSAGPLPGGGFGLQVEFPTAQQGA